MNNQAVMRGHFAKIAVAPDTGKTLEISGLVFLTVGIVQETDRHGWKRARAD